MSRVCLLQINDGLMRTECVNSIIQARTVHKDYDLLLQISGPYLDDQRNLLQQKALGESSAEWFVWIDSDIVFGVDQIEQLTDSADHPVTSGVYRTQHADGKIGPVAYWWRPRNPPQQKMEPVGEGILTGEYEHNRVRVDAVGAGLLAVHRDVWLALEESFGAPRPYFDEPNFGGTSYGEDFGLSVRLRLLHIPIWLRTDVVGAHIKYMSL